MTRRSLEQTLEHRLSRPWPWLAMLMALMAMQVSGWWWRPGGDAVGYLSMAHSLAATGRMRHLGTDHLYYAPGYPLLISPTFWLSGRPFWWISLEQMLMAWLIIAAVFYWAKRCTGRASAGVLIAAFVVCNANFWQYYRQPLSETAFVCVMMLGTLALGRSLETRNRRGIVAWTLLGAALAGLLGSIRHVGVMLAVGYAVTAMIHAWRGHITWRRAIIGGTVVLMTAGVVVAGVILSDRVKVEPAGGVPQCYWNQMFGSPTEMAGRLAEGVHRRINTTGQLLVPGLFKTYADTRQWMNPIMPLYGGVVVIVLLGWWRMARSGVSRGEVAAEQKSRGWGGDALVWMTPLYVGVYLLWPYSQGARFFVPLLPVMGVAIWRATRRWPGQQLCILTVLVIAHLAAAGGRWVSQMHTAAKDNANWPALAELATAVTGRDDVGIVDRNDVTASRLMLLTDRPVTVIAADQSIDARLRFVVISSTMPQLTDDFGPLQSAGPWTLWGRFHTPTFSR